MWRKDKEIRKCKPFWTQPFLCAAPRRETEHLLWHCPLAWSAWFALNIEHQCNSWIERSIRLLCMLGSMPCVWIILEVIDERHAHACFTFLRFGRWSAGSLSFQQTPYVHVRPRNHISSIGAPKSWSCWASHVRAGSGLRYMHQSPSVVVYGYILPMQLRDKRSSFLAKRYSINHRHVVLGLENTKSWILNPPLRQVLLLFAQWWQKVSLSLSLS